jgi:hypothetical protein
MLQEVCASQLKALLDAFEGAYRGQHFETFDLGNGCHFGSAVAWSTQVDISGQAATSLRTRARQGSLEVADEPRVAGCVYATRTLF